MQLRIKRILRADFRRKPWTLHDDLQRDQALFCGPPRTDECYVFVSATGDQVAFVFGVSEVVSAAGTRHEKPRTLIDYRAWRIDGGRFDPLLLEDYAQAVGLSLGRRTLREWWDAR